MINDSTLIATDIAGYLKKHETKGILRFITCGSVDDGKSTLIGRLLYESQTVFEDELTALEFDSKKIGTQGKQLDFALLVDGLEAEREQGITIDVAYRYFSTKNRKFIVADTPGHEEYTRNMATGASTADVAILLIDARKGVLTQTRRHAFIVSMLGVRKIVLAINKLDLMDYSQKVYEEIVKEFQKFADEKLDLDEVIPIPLSALKGDNVILMSKKTDHASPFRMPVQLVNRPNAEFRGYSGLIVSGMISAGDEIMVMPSGKCSKVERIVTMDGDLAEAGDGNSVTLTLSDELDISRGDILVCAKTPSKYADQFQTRILWMSEEPMLPSRQYILKIGTQLVSMTPVKPKHKIDVNTLNLLPAKSLDLNEIGVCNIMLDHRIVFDPYKENPAMGGFIIIDRYTNNTVGLGLIDFALHRATNVQWQQMEVTKKIRSEQKEQVARLIWLTGLSGSGKSTIANELEKRLQDLGRHSMVLDGDNVRHGLNRDLGFTAADRVENIRRIGEVSKLMLDAGLIVIASFISPFRSERNMVRSLLEGDEFIEVFINTPIEVCEQRDVKGLYLRARAGEIPNFTGISSPYETPIAPELIIDTTEIEVDEAVSLILKKLRLS